MSSKGLTSDKGAEAPKGQSEAGATEERMAGRMDAMKGPVEQGTEWGAFNTQGWTTGPRSAGKAQEETGKVLPPTESPAVEADSPTHTRDFARAVAQRLQLDGRWKGQAEFTRDSLMKSSKGKFPDDTARQAWVYGELDRMYPPLQKAEPAAVEAEPAGALSPIGDSGQIVGLSEIPAAWPELPANASLASELSWVQSNRLWMVEERPGKATIVRLDRSAGPAPSRAAIGWLETSIRSYAKFVDVAAKVSGTEQDETAVLKAERRSIDEVKALLAEMDQAEGTCPCCGQALV